MSLRKLYFDISTFTQNVSILEKSNDKLKLFLLQSFKGQPLQCVYYIPWLKSKTIQKQISVSICKNTLISISSFPFNSIFLQLFFYSFLFSLSFFLFLSSLPFSPFQSPSFSFFYNFYSSFSFFYLTFISLYLSYIFATRCHRSQHLELCQIK